MSLRPSPGEAPGAPEGPGKHAGMRATKGRAPGPGKGPEPATTVLATLGRGHLPTVSGAWTLERRGGPPNFWIADALEEGEAPRSAGRWLGGGGGGRCCGARTVENI